MSSSMLKVPDQRSPLHGTLVAAAVLMIGGCAVAPQTDQKPEDIAKVSSAVVIGEWTDFFDTINVTLVRCDWSDVSGSALSICNVPEGYVLVGGGAEVDGDEQPGAPLIWSFPGSNLKGWYARSKEHDSSYEHRIRAYAIGMRIGSQGNYLSEDDLRSQMYVTVKVTESAGGRSAALVSLSSAPEFQTGDILVGGGALLTYPSGEAGQLLYGSVPFGSGNVPTGWVAYSSDAVVPSPVSIHAYAIGMRGCPAGIDKCFRSTFEWSGVRVDQHYQNGFVTGYMGGADWSPMTSVGAFADWSGDGRFLADIIPRVGDDLSEWGAVETRSKDHEFFDNTGWQYSYVTFVNCISNCPF